MLDRGFKGFWTHFYPLVWEKTQIKEETIRRHDYFWSKDKDWEVTSLFKNIWALGYSFEKWWRKFEKKYSEGSAVNNYIDGPLKRSGKSPSFKFELGMAMFLAKRKVNGNISADDFPKLFEKELLRIMGRNSKSYFRIVVNLDSNKTDKELANDFLYILEARRKQLGMGKKAHFYKRGRFPMEPFFYQDLKRYLRVYDLRQKEKKKYSEIQSIIEKEFGAKASYLRTLPLDFKKGKQIIRNAAQGFFPKYTR